MQYTLMMMLRMLLRQGMYLFKARVWASGRFSLQMLIHANRLPVIYGVDISDSYKPYQVLSNPLYLREIMGDIDRAQTQSCRHHGDFKCRTEFRLLARDAIDFLGNWAK